MIYSFLNFLIKINSIARYRFKIINLKFKENFSFNFKGKLLLTIIIKYQK